MSSTPEPSESKPAAVEPTAAAPVKPPSRPKSRSVHEVRFTAFPKLLFAWPLILAGFIFWPLGYPGRQPTAAPAAGAATASAAPAGAPTAAGSPAAAAPTTAPAPSHRLEVLGWVYLWITIVVLLTLGVDVGRNQAVFLVVLVAALYVLGLWLRDSHHFTLFGDIYRWFADRNLQYNRELGLVLSIVLVVPYVLMLGWARLNDHWRITHNEFEHLSFGRMEDSLGRGAKSIRASYPDVFELLLGMAGTLVVYSATGTTELRRIPHVLFLPLVRNKLDRILEVTAVTGGAQAEEEEEEAGV